MAQGAAWSRGLPVAPSGWPIKSESGLSERDMPLLPRALRSASVEQPEVALIGRNELRAWLGGSAGSSWVVYRPERPAAEAPDAAR